MQPALSVSQEDVMATHVAAVVRLFLVVSALVAFPLVALAQEATITGTISDATGGVLPGVTVTAVNEASGNVFEAVTDARGVFRMPARIGTYRLTAALTGFADAIRTGLTVAVGQTVTINLQMSTAGLQESVTVTGEAPLIEVSSSALGTNITQAQMEELPVNGRNWQDLAMLAVGNKVNDVSGPGIAAEGTGTYQVNLDGQQITYEGGGLGNVQARLSRDAIAEFEFISNRFDATQGRSSGVQINAVTKGGTNTPTGLFGGYFRDSKFNAEDNIVHRKIPYSDQQLSFAYGGPIVRDKLHYFANYEFEREPSTFAWQTAYPAFNLSFTDTRREDKGGGRLDYQFSSSMHMSVRASIWRNFQPLDSDFLPTPTRHPSRLTQVTRHSDNELVTLTKVLGTRAVNEVKGGFARVDNQEVSRVPWKNHPAASSSGITNGSPIISFNGISFGPDGSIPQIIKQGNTSFRDDFTLSGNKGGRHDVKMGGEYILNYWRLMICRTCSGTYDAQAPGVPVPANLASLFPVWNDPDSWNLNAINANIRRYQLGVGNMNFNVDRHVFASWLQDDWKISSKMTLNLGLRYDVALNAFGEKFGLDPWLKANRPNDTDNIAPRVGFAYQLNDRTVLRGGFGKYFSEVTDMSAHGTVSWQKIVILDVLNDGRPDFGKNPLNGPVPTFEQAVKLTCYDQTVNQGGRRPGCIQRGITQNLAQPYSQFPFSWQGSIGLQRQLGTTMGVEADYVYSTSFYNISQRNINQAYQANGLPYAVTQVNRLPYPDWGTIGMRMNNRGRDGIEHSVQAGFTKRLSNRWQGSATYSFRLNYNTDQLPLIPGCNQPVTWTADFSRWVCDVPVNFSAFGLPLFDTSFYRGNAQRHRAVFNGIYQMPYDFQLSGVYFYGDNGYLTTTSGIDVTGCNCTVANRLRADRSVIPRNNFNKKDLHRVDIRLYRSFRFSARTSIEPTLEVFNLFNRENFTSWQLNESSPTFGQPVGVTGVAFAPRMIQLGFRARF
jgi:hypothetical protein